VVNSSGALIGGALHVDGQVSLGDDSGTCQACHPMLDGAHAAHTEALHRIALPFSCVACHAVPATVTSPGHVDQPGSPQVFPPGTSTIARAGGGQPSFDPASGRCAGTWCHGAATPAWSDSNAPVCGSCHAIPPADGPHAATMMLSDCVTCHPKTMDATGQLLPAAHVNGVIDAP
jgi:predicted CxxxxCH...CXXCH cytochrome family protein